ncbi:hypothetical protein MRB53_018791 [Persea americana]|uniref:Uncharacterized protein n=1 Tax=Persea americana TaxID=3435 RepID=A0ACC2M8Y0_PERAE|nr:hypothetical protein MRB53_018791 [Persea americana]
MTALLMVIHLTALLMARLAIEDLDEAPVLGVVAGAAEIGGEERVVDEAEGVEGDGMLGEEGEEGIHQVVEESNGEEAVGSGEEAVGGRDKHRGGALGAFPSDESALEDASGGAESGGGVGVDVDAVVVVLAMEEELSERGEGDFGVGEEDEGDFGGWDGRRWMRALPCRRGRYGRTHRGGRWGCCEEGGFGGRRVGLPE